MDQKRKEINHQINKMYRQLGKTLYDDLNKDHLNVSKYKRYSGKIDKMIRTINSLDIEMDNIEEVLEEEVFEEEIFEPAMTGDGIRIYKFCPQCNAGNHPEATRCVRCHVEFQ